MRDQPIAQPQQPVHRGGELGQLLQPTAATIRDPDRRGHLRLMHIQASDPLEHPVKHPLHTHLPARDQRSPPAVSHTQPTSLMGVLNGTVRGTGKTPTPN